MSIRRDYIHGFPDGIPVKRIVI